MTESNDSVSPSDKITDTLSGLFTQPRRIVNQFTEQNGGHYLNPFLYVLLTALIVAFAVSVSVSYPEITVTGAGPEQVNETETDRSEDTFRMAELQEVMGIVSLRMNTQYLGFLNILMIPILSLASLIFFRESVPDYYRHLVLNSYAAGQVNLFLLLLVPLWVLFNEQLHLPGVHLYPAMFLIGLILLIIYSRYFLLESLGDWIKAFSALISGYFFYSLLAGFVAAFISFLIFMLLTISEAA